METNKAAALCLSLLSSCTWYTLPNDFEKSSVKEVFTNIYQTNAWFSGESVSGAGSEIGVTGKIRPRISELIKKLKITSIADAPCGDFNWMKLVDLGACKYTGLDIVKEIIDNNIKLYESPSREFKHLDLIEDPIDKVDLILCRDLLAHLSYEQIFSVLRNFKRSGARYLLVTTGVTTQDNKDIDYKDFLTGTFRKLNLEKPPFNFPKPLVLIEEDVPFEEERGKHLGLWLISDLPI